MVPKCSSHSLFFYGLLSEVRQRMSFAWNVTAEEVATALQANIKEKNGKP